VPRGERGSAKPNRSRSDLNIVDLPFRTRVTPYCYQRLWEISEAEKRPIQAVAKTMIALGIAVYDRLRVDPRIDKGGVSVNPRAELLLAADFALTQVIHEAATAEADSILVQHEKQRHRLHGED
jgi:hypothetical protein